MKLESVSTRELFDLWSIRRAMQEFAIKIKMNSIRIMFAAWLVVRQPSSSFMHLLIWVWYVVIDLDDSTLSQTQPDANQVKSRL